MTTSTPTAPTMTRESNKPHAEWAQNFQKTQSTPPPQGTVLRPLGSDQLARLDIELIDGKPPFIYGRAYVPSIVGAPVGWYLQPMDATDMFGLKCILMPKSRDEVIRHRGIATDKVSVKALRVVRPSRSGQALLVEIAEL